MDPTTAAHWFVALSIAVIFCVGFVAGSFYGARLTRKEAYRVMDELTDYCKELMTQQWRLVREIMDAEERNKNR